jgi:hypothetical protein
MMLDQAPNGCQDNSCGQPDKARRPLTHPQLAMMHFVYEIRVTLSTKIFMFPASSAVAISVSVASHSPFRRQGRISAYGARRTCQVDTIMSV